MVNNNRLIVEALARVPEVRSKLAVFVERIGLKVRVNVGLTSVIVPFVGMYLPPPGHPVQMDYRDNEWVVSGPAAPLPGVGKITATGTPLASVLAWGTTYQLPYRSSYAPTIGDDVTITWSADGGIIESKVTATSLSTGPGANPGGGTQTFHPDPFTAVDSGSLRFGSWWTNDVYASDNNIGAWFYGTKVADTIPDSAVILSARIYLPARQVQGFKPNLGYHNSAAKPGGALSILSAAALAVASGWVDISPGYVDAIKAGGGIGLNHGGYNIYRGTASDGFSGALDVIYQA